jgi:type II secretory pathway component PulJ
MKIPQNQGYSIAEMIVYLAIFAAVSILVINAFIVMTKSFSVSRTNRDLMESGSVAMERMVREIRQATSIDTSNSVLSSNPGTLQLNSTDINGASVSVKFVTSSGALNLYQGGTLTGNLLGSNISVTNLIFRRMVTTNGEGVKIEMTLQDNRTPAARTENFYDTIILRGEY